MLRYIFPVLFVVVAVVLMGCSASDIIAGIVEDRVDNGTVTASIDGQAYRDDVAYMEVFTNTVKVYGAKRSGTKAVKVVELVFDRSAIPGTVALTTGPSRATYLPQGPDGGTEYKSYDQSGTATITFYDGNRCQGTFSFSARTQDEQQQVAVTQGTFNVRKN